MLDLKKQIGDKKRLPNLGMDNFVYAAAHLLHPYYKGAILATAEETEQRYSTTRDRLILEHPTTAAFHEAPIPDPEPSQDSDEADEIEQVMASQQTQQSTTGVAESKPPLAVEFETFRNFVKPAEKSKVDVLDWWKQNERQFPNLAPLAM